MLSQAKKVNIFLDDSTNKRPICQNGHAITTAYADDPRDGRKYESQSSADGRKHSKVRKMTTNMREMKNGQQ